MPADTYEEADPEGESVYFPATEEQDVTTRKRPWPAIQQPSSQTGVEYSQRQQREWSQRPAPSSQQQHFDEDEDIMDDYRRAAMQSQHAEEQSPAPPRPRFDFGKWSQKAEASQSIISKWKKK